MGFGNRGKCMYSTSSGGKPLISFFGDQQSGNHSNLPNVFLEDIVFFVLKLGHVCIHVSCISPILCRFSKIASGPLLTLTIPFRALESISWDIENS